MLATTIFPYKFTYHHPPLTMSFIRELIQNVQPTLESQGKIQGHLPEL